MKAFALQGGHATFAQTMLPEETLRRDLALVAGFSLFVALCAQIAVPLPFTPVPFTAQTLGVLLTGMLLGPRLGALSLLAYLAEGLAGAPVFALGTGGVSHLFGPTGGYLVAFPLAAAATGMLAARGWDRRFVTTIVAMLLGNIVIYAIALPWLAHWVGANNAVALGMRPFLVGDAIKVLIAAIAMPGGWKLLAWSGMGG